MVTLLDNGTRPNYQMDFLTKVTVIIHMSQIQLATKSGPYFSGQEVGTIV